MGKNAPSSNDIESNAQSLWREEIEPPWRLWEILGELFSLLNRLQLPSRDGLNLEQSAASNRAVSLFSPTFKKWNR